MSIKLTTRSSNYDFYERWKTSIKIYRRQTLGLNRQSFGQTKVIQSII